MKKFYSNISIVSVLFTLLTLMPSALNAQEAMERMGKLRKALLLYLPDAKLYEEHYKNRSTYALSYKSDDVRSAKQVDEAVAQIRSALSGLDAYHSFDEKFDSIGVKRGRCALRLNQVLLNVRESVEFSYSNYDLSLKYIVNKGYSVAKQDGRTDYDFKGYVRSEYAEKEDMYPFADMFDKFCGLSGASCKSLVFNGKDKETDWSMSYSGVVPVTNAKGCFLSGKEVEVRTDAIELVSEFKLALDKFIGSQKCDITKGVYGDYEYASISFLRSDNRYVEYRVATDAEGVFFLRSEGQHANSLSVASDWRKRLQK